MVAILRVPWDALTADWSRSLNGRRDGKQGSGQQSISQELDGFYGPGG
ncbi:hypothetical protein LG299_05195 [Microbacterium lacus]